MIGSHDLDNSLNIHDSSNSLLLYNGPDGLSQYGWGISTTYLDGNRKPESTSLHNIVNSLKLLLAPFPGGPHQCVNWSCWDAAIIWSCNDVSILYNTHFT